MLIIFSDDRGWSAVHGWIASCGLDYPWLDTS